MPMASVLLTVLCPLSGIAERIIEEGRRGHMSRVDKNALRRVECRVCRRLYGTQ
jgi:hypothetical protein